MATATSATVPKNLYPTIAPGVPDPAMQPKAVKPNATPTTTASVSAQTTPATQVQSYPDPVQDVPGLINVKPTGYQPETQMSGKTGYTPETFQAQAHTVDPNQTVQQQVNDIIRMDSPLMQQAAQRAREEANARGLLNSSMAIGAGQQAVIGQALPIATQDANTYAAARQSTVDALNRAGEVNAGAINTARGLDVETQNRIDLANLQANTQLETSREANMTQQLLANLQARTSITQAKISQDTQMAIASLDAGTKLSLGQLDANNRQLLQANASAAGMFQSVVDNLAKIAQSTELSSGAKKAATETQLNLLNEGLRTMNAVTVTDQQAIASLDLSKFFVQAGEPAAGGAKPAAATAAGGVINQPVPAGGGLTPAQQQQALQKRQDNANKFLPVHTGLTPAEEQYLKEREAFAKTHQGFETQEEFDNAMRQGY